MQKLSATSSGKNNKSCGIFHHESNKIGFAFFWFFYYFLRNLQESAEALYYWSFRFLPRPLDFTAGSQIYPYLARNTLELVGASQLGPPGRPAAVRPKFRRARRCSRPGKGGATLGEYLGLGLHWIRGPGLVGVRARRRRAAAGAACPFSARAAPGRGNARWG
jgi:hypothetical protein